MAQNAATYPSGHHESVLRSHTWRTAANSAAYLLGAIRPDMSILDVGCGPGTITADFAQLVPQGHVIGVENVPDVLDQARAYATKRGLTNVEFKVADIHALDFPDNTFDVVHAHQVLQHVGDPVHALSEMRRVTKPGGIVAARECDFSSMTWWPEVEGLSEWQKLWIDVARSNGGEPNAGRQLHAWARKAGFDRASITTTAGTWCYSTPDERAWWSEMWADRIEKSTFATNAIDRGFSSPEQLARIAKTWREWGTQEDGWFGLLHGEIVCRV
ncbi:hypothetical protein PLICRDRAFT_153313 [Plicaturopsis crispa FD-325 SS-3]|nr:hypothetical protein PLICRDRAFT_153313 [Plicaturopsis crispa FD-325 SS-3]